MKVDELRQKYIGFFVKRGHKEISNISLVPEHDPTVLFTTAGMHPLIPYLLGEEHPQGKRLVSIQRCLRTDDIDEVGDATHNTFFEMLGNWSLGDYWKEEAIEWSFEFLTKELGTPLVKLAVTIFEGDKDAPRDNESADIWKGVGIPQNRIFPRPKKDNWWGPVGNTGPCGPDTEMFVWAGKDTPSGIPNEEPLWIEVWNDVFMQYNRKSDDTYEPLNQRNVDTGMGLERMLMILQGKDNVYETDVFLPLASVVGGETADRGIRILLDHLRAGIMLIADGVQPSNKERGYVLRRLIRRAVTKGKEKAGEVNKLVDATISIYKDVYGHISPKREAIIRVLNEEISRFERTLTRGLGEFEKAGPVVSGQIAFDLYQSYGFPLELIRELVGGKGWRLDERGFEEALKKHQQISRTASAGKFAGGLADHSETTIRGHTATHLLHQALRDILGDNVHQTGSNITPERVRFDFAFNRKLTDEELQEVEEIVNKKVKEDLSVHFKIMTLDQAQKIRAIGLFDEKYSDKVKVYFIGDPSTGSGRAYSAEFCGGPHVEHTAQVGRVKITKETSAGAGNRRIYMILE